MEKIVIVTPENHWFEPVSRTVELGGEQSSEFEGEMLKP